MLVISVGAALTVGSYLAPRMVPRPVCRLGPRSTSRPGPRSTPALAADS